MAPGGGGKEILMELTNAGFFRTKLSGNIRDRLPSESVSDLEEGAMSHYISEYVNKALEHIKGYADIKMGKNLPISISNTDQDHKLNILIAPKIEE